MCGTGKGKVSVRNFETGLNIDAGLNIHVPFVDGCPKYLGAGVPVGVLAALPNRSGAPCVVLCSLSFTIEL